MWTMRVWRRSSVTQARPLLRNWKPFVRDNPDYSNDAVVGKAGIEQYMELELQGKDGEETVTVDNLGKVLEHRQF